MLLFFLLNKEVKSGQSEHKRKKIFLKLFGCFLGIRLKPYKYNIIRKWYIVNINYYCYMFFFLIYLKTCNCRTMNLITCNLGLIRLFTYGNANMSLCRNLYCLRCLTAGHRPSVNSKCTLEIIIPSQLVYLGGGGGGSKGRHIPSLATFLYFDDQIMTASLFQAKYL